MISYDDDDDDDDKMVKLIGMVGDGLSRQSGNEGFENCRDGELF